MEPVVRKLVDISDSPAAMRARADMVLERGHWASTVFQRFSRDDTMRIVDVVARAAFDNAAKYAEWAVRETGFGVVEHKKIKNELTSTPLVDYYRDLDLVNPRIDASKKIIEIPRPAGVIFALAPSTNPVCTINFKILLALMSRNAIVISPHPAAEQCCSDAVKMLSQVASDAGAPDGVIQIVEQPGIPLIEEFMASPRTSVVLATGGSAMVRAAYSSSNPAIGVGPGNAPVFVDGSADINKAASHIVSSKSFDNSVLCTNESVLITLDAVDSSLQQALKRQQAYVCNSEETERVRRLLFHEHGFNVECVGRDASWLAKECGIRVPASTKILVTPIEHIGAEERLSSEKLCPVLAYVTCQNRNQAIASARAVLRLSGAGHSAAIHTTDEQTAMTYAASVEAYRVVVNAPCSQGAAGYETNLAPTFTIGTGFLGRSSIGENIGPQHLVHWTKMAYNAAETEPFGDYAAIHFPFDGPLPQAPSDGVPGSQPAPVPAQGDAVVADVTRDELRKIIAEELRAVLKR